MLVFRNIFSYVLNGWLLGILMIALRGGDQSSWHNEKRLRTNLWFDGRILFTMTGKGKTLEVMMSKRFFYCEICAVYQEIISKKRNVMNTLDFLLGTLLVSYGLLPKPSYLHNWVQTSFGHLRHDKLS